MRPRRSVALTVLFLLYCRMAKIYKIKKDFEKNIVLCLVEPRKCCANEIF